MNKKIFELSTSKFFLLHRQLLLTAFIVVILLIIYTIDRAGFLFFNYEKFSSFSITQLLDSFISGIRFDLSAIFMANLIPFLFLNLPGKIFRNQIYERIILLIVLCVNIILILISITDYTYFKVTERRMGYEIYVIFSDIINILPGLIVNHYLISIIVVLSSIVIVKLSLLLFVKYQNKFQKKLLSLQI